MPVRPPGSSGDSPYRLWPERGQGIEATPPADTPRFSCRIPRPIGFNGAVNEDLQLLRQYATEGSKTAFHELVNRYANLVFSTSLRRVHGRLELASEVAQQVFVDLARKAGRIPSGTQLGGWLHRNSGYIATTTLRAESRRPDREPAGHVLDGTGHSGESLMELLGFELDAALDELPEHDLDVLVLRYLSRLNLRRVGALLELSDDDAHKRVIRALEKLRLLFSRRGHTVSLVVLGILLSEAGTGTAPHAFAAGATAAALAVGPVGVANAPVGSGAGSDSFFMKPSNVALLVVLAIGLAAPLVWQRRQIERLTADNQGLVEETARVRQEREKLTTANDRLRDGTESARSTRAELMRLRGELARARAETEQARRLAEAAAKGLPAPAQPVTQDNTGDHFKAALRATVPPGSSVLTGGWTTGPGRRAIVLVTPSVGGDDPAAEQILIDTRIYEATEDLLSRLGYSGFFLSGSDLRNSTLTADETTELTTSLETDGELTVISHPRVITTAGNGASVAFGSSAEKGIQFEFMPRSAANRAVDLSLEVKTIATPQAEPEPKPVKSP